MIKFTKGIIKKVSSVLAGVDLKKYEHLASVASEVLLIHVLIKYI